MFLRMPVTVTTCRYVTQVGMTLKATQKKRNKMTTRSADQCRLLSNGRIPAWLRGCVEHIQAVTRVLPRTFRKFARYCIWRRG